MAAEEDCVHTNRGHGRRPQPKRWRWGSSYPSETAVAVEMCYLEQTSKDRKAVAATRWLHGQVAVPAEARTRQSLLERTQERQTAPRS